MHGADWLDEFEAELGVNARLRLIANIGGQKRKIPQIDYAGNSRLAGEIGSDAARWLAEHFGGEELDIPSLRSMQTNEAHSRLMADVLEAGLDAPTRSANELATTHGVTRRWVQMVRQRLREERRESADQLRLFE